MRWLVVALAAIATGITAAQADNSAGDPQFGFTEDTDIGARGDIGWEIELEGQFGRGAGTYRALAQMAMLKFTVTDQLRLAPVLFFDAHRIRNVPGFDNTSRWDFAGAGFEAKYKILDRAESPIGLAVGALPYWRRIDDESGTAVRAFGSGFVLAAEREIVPQRLFAAFNVIYELAASRERATAEWEHSSGFGLSGALAAAVHPGVFVSAEVRYARAYDGLGLDRLSGEAWFAGPGLSVRLNDALQLNAAWTTQVSGRDSQPGAGRLDLINFSRHQVLLQLEGEF